MKMSNINLLKSENAVSNGFLALLIVGLIALGCTCDDKEGFKLKEKRNENSNSSTPKKIEEGNPFETPSGTPAPKKDIVKADASKREVPSDEELQEIVKETLLNFNDALQRGDFSDFHKMISKTWQREAKPKDFEGWFKQFIEKKVDIGEIRNQKATFSPDPKVGRKKNLRGLLVNGSYPTSPTPTQFELIYTAEGKDWKLSGIKIRTNSLRRGFQK